MPTLSGYDRGQLARIARGQYDVVARSQALECGMTRGTARRMTRLSDVQALVCEAVQRGRCALEELVAELNEGPTAGARRYRMALAEVSEGIRSAAEAQLKHLIDRSDLEKPVYDADLYTLDGIFLGRPGPAAVPPTLNACRRAC